MNVSGMLTKYGQSLTVQRSPAVSTTGYLKGVESSDVQTRNNLMDFFVVADSNVVSGEVISDGTDYYLVVDANPVIKGDETLLIKGMVMKCNASVTIKKLTGGAWATVKSAVKCLITKSKLNLPDDEAGYRNKARGNQQINYVYMSASEELQGIHYIEDGSRTLKVLNDISPYIAGGVVEAQAILET
jgi:hypothetical protein